MLVGDGVVGKISFVVSYIMNGYFMEYIFIVFDNFLGKERERGVRGDVRREKLINCNDMFFGIFLNFI